MTSESLQVVPFTLKDAPSLIERVFPAQKVSAEAQDERTAHAGQRLTSLGSYWKGRKPLFLVRACVLGCLLPATDRPEQDLAIFEILMGIDDSAFKRRVKRSDRWPAILALPYLERLDEAVRPDQLSEDTLLAGVWDAVNGHLGTFAKSLPELVEQLGLMRFGHRPRVGDVFSGGGSIPFEAARVGCDVFASDLNPIACMLTWGALHVIGASPVRQAQLAHAQGSVAADVDREILALGIECDERGNRAKAYLYCLETRCPKTGWLVPLSPSWTISRVRRTVAVLVPVHSEKRFEIQVINNATDEQMATSLLGTIRDSALTYELDGEQFVTPIKTIRGDTRRADGTGTNALRLWQKTDCVPHVGDIFQERLYCIQWMTAESLDRARPETYFAAPTVADLDRERRVQELVGAELCAWQKAGFVPDMTISEGAETTRLIRERGWTYWHHLFNPRQLLIGALVAKAVAAVVDPELRAMLAFDRTFIADNTSRLSHWKIGSPSRDGRAPSADGLGNTFYNQALNTLYTYGARGFRMLRPGGVVSYKHASVTTPGRIETTEVGALREVCDIFITDPPYADAVIYDEITEFFIAWLRRDPPGPFSDWTWDSRRTLAIRGEGEEFRQKMVEAYSAMARHMPANGIQIAMFTHQSNEVWADMAQIFWGAGLQVMAAWYIATETSSDLKKGGYVQGTVILVLRKRKTDEAGYRDEIVQEIKAEVAHQIDTMVGLNQSLKGHGRIENLFEDADLQMAGYAAAVRVLTAYARIDGTDMTREALRPRRKNEKSLVSEIMAFAVQVANEHLVPEGMDARVWERLSGSERFYLKMLDIETTGAKKLDNYQNFAKAFRVPDYAGLMHHLKPNDARLRNAVQFKKGGFDDSEFGRSPTRAMLFALYELQSEVDADAVMGHLRDLVEGYVQQRESLIAVTAYVALKRQRLDEGEAKAARILHGLIRNERLGG